MQTTSATYDRILAGTDISYETQLVIDDVGTYGESDLMSISTNIEMFQEDPDIGKAIASEINVVMLNPIDLIPTMARIRPQVKAKGIAPKSSKVTIVDEDLASSHATYSSENITFDSDSGATVVSESLTFAVDSTEYLESEWIAQGIFYIDTREVTANNNGLDILTINGFDAMLKTEQMYSSNETVGDALDISYVQTIADAIGVAVDPRTWGIMGTGYMIPFPVGYSMREILGYIASAYAGCFIISDTGQLRLVALEDIEDETRYLIDEICEIIVFGSDSPAHTVTASGAVATFTAGGEYPLDELEISIEPVQDLRGQPAPYPDGSGKNKFDQSSYVWGTGNNVVYRSMQIPNGTYTFSTDFPNNSTKDVFILAGQVSSGASSSTNGVSSTTSRTITVTDGYYTVASRKNSGRPAPKDYNWQLEEGSFATSYAPFGNICPILGWTGCEIYESDNAPQTFIDGKYYNDNGVLTNTANTRYEAAYIPVSFYKRYTFTFGTTATNRLRVHEYDSNQTWLRQVISTPVSTTEISYIPSNDASYIRFSYPIACNTVNLCLEDVAISWETEAGTVYYGTLNVKTGVLTAISAIYEPPNNTSDFVQGSGNVYIGNTVFISKGYEYPIDTSKDLSSHFKGLSTSSTTVPSWSISSSGYFAVNGVSGVTDTVANWKAYLAEQRSAGTPVQFLMRLATPLTFQLTPTQVQTLVGQNNLWANTGNIINLEFTEPASEATRILV